MNYLPVELHCHTIHSDGDFTPASLQKAAVQNGLSLIALTDHNTLSGTEGLNADICPFIRGIEWTTYFGHMLVLGAKSFVDWRDAVPDNIDEKISAVKAAGGTVGVAHPYQCGSPICTGGRWEFKVNNWENVDYIEIWHESFSEGNTENDRATVMWTRLLDRGYHLAATYGRDWHRPGSGGLFGCTYLGLDGEVTEAAALKAIKQGRTAVSTGAKFAFTVSQAEKIYNIGDTLQSGAAKFNFITDFSARAKYTQYNEIKYNSMKIVTNGGITVCEIRADKRAVEIELESDHWYRAELLGTVDGNKFSLAITSPIYVR